MMLENGQKRILSGCKSALAGLLAISKKVSSVPLPLRIDALAAAAGSDKDKNVRLAAIEALMKIGGAKAAAAAETLKNDPDPEIKTWAGAAAEKLRK